jgi:hypothetical protein
MPYCPKCRAEYVYGVRSCLDCEEPLVEELPPDAGTTANVRFVTAFQARHVMEAHLIQGILEAEGIPCLLVGAREQIYPQLPVFIQVPEDRLEEAQQLLEEVRQAPPPDPEDLWEKPAFG